MSDLINCKWSYFKKDKQFLYEANQTQRNIYIQYKSQERSEAFNNNFSTIGLKLANAIYCNWSDPSPLTIFPIVWI